MLSIPYREIYDQTNNILFISLYQIVNMSFISFSDILLSKLNKVLLFYDVRIRKMFLFLIFANYSSFQILYHD